MSNDEAHILMLIAFGGIVLFSQHGDKKAVVLAIALQFSQEFNTQPFEYKFDSIEHFATVQDSVITLDQDLIDGLDYKRIKSLVYHTSGVAAGLPLSEGKDFMNPKRVLKKYHETKKLQVPN